MPDIPDVSGYFSNVPELIQFGVGWGLILTIVPGIASWGLFLVIRFLKNVN